MDNQNPSMETQPTTAPVSNSAPMPSTSTGKSKLPIIVGVVALLVCLCIVVIVAIVLILRNQPGSPIANIINNVTVQPLSEAEQQAFFQKSTEVFTNKDRSFSMKGSGSGGDYEIVFDAKTKITKYSGALTGGEDSEFYIAPDKTYYQMGEVWYYMETGSDDSGMSGLSTESLGISDTSVMGSNSYKGVTSCPGATQGTCHKFQIGTDSTYGGEYYFLPNGDMVYFSSTMNGEVQIVDLVFDSVEVELPDEVKNAKSFEEFLNFQNDSFDSQLDGLLDEYQDMEF